MAYQDALSLYNSGKIEEAFQELKKCDSSPMVEGLRKECVKLIEEQYRFLIQDALRENPQSAKAGFLYNTYANKYGPNERLKNLIPVPSFSSAQQENPIEDSHTNKSGIIIISVITAILVIGGIFVYINKSNSSDDILISEWDNAPAVEDLDSVVVEEVYETPSYDPSALANIKEASKVYEFDLPDGRHRVIFNGCETGEYSPLYLYAATYNGNEKPQIQRIALKYDRYDDGSDFNAGGLTEYARCKIIPNDKIYALTSAHANSNGWTTEFQLFLVDCQTLSAEHLLDCAAARGTDDGGVTVAIARLTNEDTAEYTAEEIWLMHDLHFDNRGNPESVGNEEYSYSEMQRLFGENLTRGFFP